MPSTRAAALCLMLAPLAGWAQEPEPVGEQYFAMLGVTLLEPDDRRNPQLDGGDGLELRYGFHPAPSGWGYELRAFHEILEKKPDGDTGNRSGLGADAIYRLPEFLFMTGYGLAGLALAYSDALPGRDWVGPVVNGGLGIETGALRMVTGGLLRFRIEARYSYEDNRDEYSDPTVYDRSNYTETRAFAGFHYAFAQPAPKSKEPVDVVPSEPEPASPPAESPPGL